MEIKNTLRKTVDSKRIKMKTFPDFTWEWIIESCERLCKDLQNRTDPKTAQMPERLKDYVQSAQGLIAVIPKLREHPQLEKLVPMKSLLSLRWFPGEDYEVSLYCEVNQVRYSITVVKGIFGDFDIREKKVVSFSEVADEIYAYITRLSQE
jgi:hypothetical protein